MQNKFKIYLLILGFILVLLSILSLKPAEVEAVRPTQSPSSTPTPTPEPVWCHKFDLKDGCVAEQRNRCGFGWEEGQCPTFTCQECQVKPDFGDLERQDYCQKNFSCNWKKIDNEEVDVKKLPKWEWVCTDTCQVSPPPVVTTSTGGGNFDPPPGEPDRSYHPAECNMADPPKPVILSYGRFAADGVILNWWPEIVDFYALTYGYVGEPETMGVPEISKDATQITINGLQTNRRINTCIWSFKNNCAARVCIDP